MPSEKILEQKKQYVASLSEKISASTTGVIVDYKGINVANDTKMRKALREAGVEYTVVKNTYLKLALEQSNITGLDSLLEGTTAVAMWSKDSFEGAKILSKQKDITKEFAVKGGFMDGKAVDAATVEQLAKLPSKEMMIAKLLGTFNAPVAAFARVLNAVCEQQESE